MGNQQDSSERIDQAVPESASAPTPRNRKLGYFLGTLVSTVAGILVALFIIGIMMRELLRCVMSLGCPDSGMPIPIILALAGYVSLAIVVAMLTRRIFKSSFGIGLLWNLAPLVTLIVLQLSVVQYEDYAFRRDRTRNIKTAISDAPFIQLGEPFIKKTAERTGGVLMLVHVPFTVSRPVRAWSLALLVRIQYPVQFSTNPRCNDGFVAPTPGFHVVDREYDQSPMPSLLGPMLVSEQLEPNKQYYLIQEKHFSYSPCKVSDFQEFDEKQIHAMLSTGELGRL
jgi:hypothetical protein